MLKLVPFGVKQHAQVVMARWTLLVGAAYLVLFGSDSHIPEWQQIAFVGLLLANLGLYATVVRQGRAESMRWLTVLSDIVFITSAVALTGQASNDFFLFFFLVLMIAGISSQFGLTVLATVAVCAFYAFMLWSGLGAELWHSTDLMIRLPFLFGVGLFFGSLSIEARREESRIKRQSSLNKKMVHRYHQIASERDRTRALLEIGQAGLSSRDATGVLQQISSLIQQTMRIDRCSLVVFNEGERHAYLAASSDQPAGDVVLLLPLTHYPELRETLQTGEITELHADDSHDLWKRVQKHLPRPHQFRSWLVVPIMQQESVAGAFFLRDARPEFSFHDDERVFCEAAALMTASYSRGRDLVEEMRRRSRLDGLTGLLNFPTFRHDLEEGLAGHDPAGDQELSLIMVDIDNLKVINDRYGHMMGNDVIE